MCFEGKVDYISNVIIESGKGGGAIYSDNKCEMNLCPIVWTNKTKLTFAENYAVHRAILYEGMLDRCEHLPGQSLKLALKILTMSNYRMSSITSPATNFCFKDNCSVRTRMLHSILKEVFKARLSQSQCLFRSWKPRGHEPTSTVTTRFSQISSMQLTLEDMVSIAAPFLLEVS